MQPHGSGGQYGAQLSAPAGNTAITNVTGLPTGQKIPGDSPAMPFTVNTVQPDTVGSKYGVPGRPVAGAYGNPGAATQRPDAPSSGAPPWSAGQAQRPQDTLGQYPDSRVTTPNVLHEVGWRGGFQIANDKLWATDRHAYLDAGTERGGGRDSGFTDPPLDGPARPALRLVQRTINYQQGSDATRNQDEQPGENRAYNRVTSLRKGYEGPSGSTAIPACAAHGVSEPSGPGQQYLGEQGTGWSPVYGGVPGLWQPYGSYAGYTADSIKGIQSPAPEGALGDGPQKVFSGLPHGLHSQTYPDYSSTLGRYLAIPQMAAPRMDRPSNSTAAGQSYSQTVMPQGQTGTVAQRTGGAGSGVNWRAVTAGWRGIRPGGAHT